MIITWIISALILLNSIWCLFHPDSFIRFILHPVSIVRDRQYYRIFTADFVHNDFVHLLMNLVMLIFVCGELEKFLVLHYPHGEFYYLSIYLICMLTGNMLVTLFNRQDMSYSSAGGSGSILGCMFALMIGEPNLPAFYLPFIGSVKNKFDAIFFILMLVVYQAKNPNKNINHELHFYGALGGLAAGLIVFKVILPLG